MKYKIFISILASMFILATSCSEDLTSKVKLNIEPSAENGLWEDNVLVVKKGTPVKFAFKGNVDFITFFSGEESHEYSKREKTKYLAEEITSRLVFEAEPEYGVIPNTMGLYLSTDFSALNGANKKQDSINIDTHTWINVSEECDFPIGNKEKKECSVALDAYLEDRLTIGFKYEPDQNLKAQPTWVLNNVRIEHTNIKTGTKYSVPAISMDFKALDMYATPELAYKSTGGPGIWNTSKVGDYVAEIRIASSKIGEPLNKDWLISSPIPINTRPTDKGVGIKSISQTLNDYSHVYNEVGTYTLNFVATNTNFEHTSQIMKEFTIKVIEDDATVPEPEN